MKRILMEAGDFSLSGRRGKGNGLKYMSQDDSWSKKALQKEVPSSGETEFRENEGYDEIPQTPKPRNEMTPQLKRRFSHYPSARPVDKRNRLGYSRAMRIFEVHLRSGAKAEVTAEVLQDNNANDNKIYFYRDHSLKQLVAYFNREDVAGITFGQENSGTIYNRVAR